jgi:hypothetical protein
MLNYNWTVASGNDVGDIVKLAEQHFQNEIDTFFNPEPVTYSRNITLAVVHQFYLPSTTSLLIYRDTNNKLIAYTWCDSQERAPWSDDHMVYVKMAHVDLSLTTKERIKVIKDMMTLWELFAISSNTPVICSTTMRKDQSAFLKLHERNGYTVRGSFAYKRLNTTQATPAN